MKRDYLNFTISAFRPIIQQHHIEYERKKFSEIVEKLPSKQYSMILKPVYFLW